MPYIARREGQSDDEYFAELKEFNDRWYRYQEKARKEHNDRMLELALEVEKAERSEREPLGMPDDEPEQSFPESED